MRRYAGSELADRYQEIFAFHADGDHSQPRIGQRTLGDFLDPTRPGSAQALINAVTMRSGIDAAGWSFRRALSFANQINAE